MNTIKTMKSFSIGRLLKPGVCIVLLSASLDVLQAQTGHNATLSLTLNDAIRHAKNSNKLVGVLKTEQAANGLDLEDARMGVLPRVHSNASYQRYTNVTVFDGVWSDPKGIPKPPVPDAGALSLEAGFNLYAGGRQRAVITDMQHKHELASINTKEQESNIGLQVALQYLDLIRLYFQEQLITDQIERAKTRAKNISSFYTNGKVTKSDLLRAEVQLSNVLLNEIANKNDYLVSNQRLNTLLNIDPYTKIIPSDTVSLNLQDSLELAALLKDYSSTFSILKAQKNIELQENRTKLAKSFNLPAVSLFAGYGFNYPNTMIFPPVAQTIAVGTAGVKITYEISSLYHNKHRVRSSRLREAALKDQKGWIEDNVKQEAQALAIKYNEAMNRLTVIKKSIEQAEINYNIQNTKYVNQLTLLTDLLEADNLYQETQFNYIQANIAALSIYYRLLFITGKL
ncbi:TolC family protein [Pseudoflavitalea rhizosphaerae]|uniref:TolC family protein n=1 Tax=Pseudoflavitalea rhizosphaerae TaxID=1884793 RepID=UPI0013DF9240|nr:TolC family protein [Pseudoflavitalea rhizosphaerae]